MPQEIILPYSNFSTETQRNMNKAVVVELGNNPSTEFIDMKKSPMSADAVMDNEVNADTVTAASIPSLEISTLKNLAFGFKFSSLPVDRLSKMITS